MCIITIIIIFIIITKPACLQHRQPHPQDAKPSHRTA